MKFWVTDPTELVAFNFTWQTPPALALGFPEMVAVPPLPAVKCNPLGNVPVSVIVAAGDPLVFTVKLKGLDVFAVAVGAEVKAGACLTVTVRTGVAGSGLAVCRGQIQGRKCPRFPPPGSR